MNRTHALLPFLLAATLLAACADAPDAVQPRTSEAEQLASVLKERTKLVDPRDAGIGKRLADLAFIDLAGQLGRLSDFGGGKGLVLVVRDVGCPVSKRYGPETARLDALLSAQGIPFLYINPSEHNTLEEMRSEVELFGFQGRYVADRELAFARALHPKTTTEVFLIDSARTLRYRGAIDDQYGRGVSQGEPRRRYLVGAAEALLAGEEVPFPATSAPGCFLAFDEEPESAAPPAPITYHDQVARILQGNCVECHRAGGAGPFSLASYEEARGRRGMVRFVVRERLMPPWFADPHVGAWENDRSLSEADRDTLLAWIEAGAPEGDPADAPLARAYEDNWQIGHPDVVFPFPEPFEVPAEGIVDLTRVISDVVVPRDLWVERLQVLPGAPQVVHHATIMFQPPPEALDPGRRILDTLAPWKKQREGWEFLIGYLPGKGPRIFEEGVARFLPKGSRIRFEMHYTPNGVATPDLTRLGLVLAEAPPRFVAESRLLRNRDFVIAPETYGEAWTIEQVLPFDSLLRSLTPHMHLIGDTFAVDLQRPGESPERLLEIPAWDPDWQFSYVFRDKPFAPAGSKLFVTATFDNRSDNPENLYPGRVVRDGPQIWDEMLILALEWIRPFSD